MRNSSLDRKCSVDVPYAMQRYLIRVNLGMLSLLMLSHVPLFASRYPNAESLILILLITEIMANVDSLSHAQVIVDSSSHAQVVVTACIVLPILSSVFVVVRIWTRQFITHSLGWDDC